MRQDERFHNDPSDQMQLELPGLTDEGEELMDDARKWCARNWDAFNWYKNEAVRSSANGYASPNFLLQSMRNKFRVSVPNAYAAPLARIAMEQNRSIKFRIAKSKVDGFTTAVLK